MIKIFGKDYITVAERLKLANGDLLSVNTEVLFQEPVVVKATIVIKNANREKVFTGISAANPTKMIEKSSPYEVAETSAVGRALGFAGYGIVDGIATADEMTKSGISQETVRELKNGKCIKCNAPAGKPHASGCVE